MIEKQEVEIEIHGVAEKTDAPADEGIFTEIDLEPMHDIAEDDISAKSCTNGHIRRKRYKGVCYCQMCCGGNWLYFYKVINGKRKYLTCGGGAWTVNCSGNRWILQC